MNYKIYYFLLITFSVVNAVKDYNGYKVYRVVPRTEDDVKLLEEFRRTSVGEFWDDNLVVNYRVNMMVPGDMQGLFLNSTRQTMIEVEEVIPDLQKAIEDQLKPATGFRSSETFHGYSWDRYHNLETINTWMNTLVQNYPGIVRPVVMGRSVENREIRGIIINYKPEKTNKLMGILEGTLHAREWIAPATVTWIVKEFLTSTDPQVRAMAENIEWHVFPVVNPDGYHYSFTTHRMWRKNRSPESFGTCEGADDDMSHGVDLNRNFDFVWMSVGASNNPCSNTFAGPRPFSEPESRAISQYVLNLKEQGEIIYYLAYHSYTQLIVIPYSHVTGSDVLLANNYADMYEIGIRSADAIAKRYGTVYRVGVSSEILYPISGGSFDWVKKVADVPITFLIELRDLGEYGFLLPPEQIIPNNLETMDGLIEMDRVTKLLGYYSAGAISKVISLSVLVLCSMVIVLFN
ncbi:zinc carboxypeptidase-like [Bombyx mandarina]|uniref:Zinc carboxypeptidase-like n=1 Tax=Bombyx mandarina TaxID=7092 RepID=A0A6J2JP20_BOMMA|nr:zinc carboxypeptidase-like [Bombyx mandarina]